VCDSKSHQAGTPLNVKQRTFAIAKKGDLKTVLRTGYIGPCVAFYGINVDKGVAFMSHIDGKICGLKSMVEQLKHEADGDLQGFSLYLTTNHTFTLRILALVAIATFLMQWPATCVFDALLVFAMTLYFCFGSVVQVYWIARIRFKTWKVVPEIPNQIFGRVEILIDASSTTGPDKPREESLSKKESKNLYRFPHCWWADMKPVSRD